jgi:hypothetical protein
MCDSWRNVHGSFAMSVLVSFFNSNKERLDSDQSCCDFAKSFLENSKFLYSNSDDDDPKVQYAA